MILRRMTYLRYTPIANLRHSLYFSKLVVRAEVKEVVAGTRD